jgi:ABC-type branched-subunit amino acid transport system ATPase component/MFS family permease
MTDLASPPGDPAPPEPPPVLPGPGGADRDTGGVMSRVQRWRPSSITRGAVATPLVVLSLLWMFDELSREMFSVLVPDIQRAYGLDIQAVLTLTSLVTVVVLFLEVPIAHLADRRRRTTIAATGQAVWAMFNVLTALAPPMWLFAIARAGSSLGRAVGGATHRALLTDYYDVDARPGVFGVHGAAFSAGQFLGPLFGGVVALYFGWQMPFLLITFPVVILLWFAFRLPEPVRGYHERRLMGADEKLATTEEEPASLSEAWRTLWQVRTLRRIWISLPIVTIPVYALSPLLQIFYEQELGLNSAQRGFISAVADPFQIVGLMLGIPFAAKLLRRDPRLLFRFLAATSSLQVVALFLLVFTRNLPLVIATRCLLALSISCTVPALGSALSLILPPRVRSVGFTIGNLFLIPTLIMAPVIGGLADRWGIEKALLAVCPIMIIGVILIASSGDFLAGDVAKVRASTLAMAEHRAARERGEEKLLLVRDVDVHYDGVQVLFGINLELDQGEMIALLGTNGAGKSTLLRAISGLVEPSAGAILFDGTDMTHTPPNEVVARGVVQVPGGKGVFPSLTVAENLKLAGWPYDHDPDYVRRATDEVVEQFPILRRRWDDLAGNLSGGEQQMLTLGMAFIAKPKLLMIDELSLGLAPAVVEQLLGIVAAIRERGTTIILVEQSVNVALTLAETAYFLEKGEIKFHGPTRELLDRPDVLRSVFLEGAGARAAGDAPNLADALADALTGAAHDAGVPASPGLAGTLADAANETGVGTHGLMATAADLAAALGPLPEDAYGPAVATPPPVSEPPRPAAPPAVARAPLPPPDPDAVPALEAIELTLSYGGVRAVNAVSFTLPQGQILGLIGPNGAGKTTLLDLISGYLPPDRGRLLFQGEDVTDLRADARALRGLGRSFQDARLIPSLTVAENIALGLERFLAVRDLVSATLNLPAVRDSEAKVQARVDELIDLVGISAFRDKFVRELSTGSRRIVDLCCVLAHEPDVILFDEPSSGIAQRESEALGPMLLRIREMTGSSLIIIEHDMPLITSVSDEILALDLGTVVTQGPPEQVLHDARVVASYLGTNEAAIARSGLAPPSPPA